MHQLNIFSKGYCYKKEKSENLCAKVSRLTLFTILVCFGVVFVFTKGPPLSLGLGRKEMFYLTTHSTHFIYGYMASNLKDHSDSERRNPLPPHGLFFPISSNGSFICIIPQTG